jgi:hypothetical protein
MPLKVPAVVLSPSPSPSPPPLHPPSPAPKTVGLASGVWIKDDREMKYTDSASASSAHIGTDIDITT